MGRPQAGPRERLVRHGIDALDDAELIALVFGTGMRGEPVMQLARRLVDTHGGLRGLVALGRGELATLRGVGESRAARLLAAVELGRRIVSAPLQPRAAVRSSQDIADALAPQFVGLTQEHFVAVALDAKNRPIAELRVASGGLTSCMVSPSDVFRALLREAAASVVFVHNHPSGEPEPSEDDRVLTERLVLAGELLGVRVLDHVILGRDKHFSFADTGQLVSKRTALEKVAKAAKARAA